MSASRRAASAGRARTRSQWIAAVATQDAPRVNPSNPIPPAPGPTILFDRHQRAGVSHGFVFPQPALSRVIGPFQGNQSVPDR